MTRRYSLALLCVLLTWRARAADPDPRMIPPRDAVTGKLPASAPLPPAEAAKTFQVLDGFRMDLLAAEPLVASPVAMAYDENGRAYVCEMRDYPYTDKAHHQRNQENPTDAAIGTIRLLEDLDGDGVFDKATIFAEALSWPTGVACWRGGVFVAATPDIWYLKDTDGDGKADIRRKVFTGFRKFNVQSVMNNLVWGLDNKIYGAGSSNGGQIRHADDANAKTFAMGRNDFRFDPVTEEFELLSGGARFGGSFDDWGNRFLCDIRNPAQHVVLPRQYLARNPYLSVASTLNDAAEAGDQLPVYRISPPEAWRVLRAKRWAGERDIIMPRSELAGAGVVTASSGITVYRGAAYPEKYRDNLFVCECAGNLFYRLQLASDGPTFKAGRVDGKAEIVASTDNWFRPVNFINAPDGTLHVMDMYRENIEHPWSIPDDIHAAVDLESGRERGRIWRLAPRGFKPPKPPRLGAATASELVQALENPNSWWRETAQRLIFERQDSSAVRGLREMVKGGKTPQARLHALWTLRGLWSLQDAQVLHGLRDAHPGVRENAVKLAEFRWRFPPIAEALLGMMADPAVRVRFQLALTLGEIKTPKARLALAAIALRDGANPWMREAILSSVTEPGPLLGRVLNAPTFAELTNSRPFIQDLAQMIGARNHPEEIETSLRLAGITRTRLSPTLSWVVLGIGEGLKRSGGSLRSVPLNPEERRGLDRLFAEAERASADSQAPLDARIAAIRLLALDGPTHLDALAALAGAKEPQEVQRAAVAAIGSFSDPRASTALLEKWRQSVPAIRSEIVLTMLSGRAHILPLLRAIENGVVPANQVPFARRGVLLRSGDAKVKEIAARLFGDGAPAPRKEIVAKYEAALAISGDRTRGRNAFEKTCAVCHRAGDLGKDVGPNLATIRQWNPEQVLINILDPNREVAPNFLSYTVETRDGRTIDGIITGESASSVTLKRGDAAEETILRRDISQISGSGLSLMPEGLEGALSVQDMADLIAFLLSAP